MDLFWDWSWQAAMVRARRCAQDYGRRTRVMGYRREDGSYGYRVVFARDYK